MKQLPNTKNKIHKKNIHFKYPPNYISKKTTKNATSTLDDSITHPSWPAPKPYPTPKLNGPQRKTYPFSCATFCYTCQETQEKLKHSTYTCPYTQCNKCKIMGHHTTSCIEIIITLPPFTKINRNTTNQQITNKTTNINNGTKTNNSKTKELPKKSLIPDLQLPQQMTNGKPNFTLFALTNTQKPKTLIGNQAFNEKHFFYKPNNIPD